ncbi:MAG: AMP-binding protein [Saprospiraceae bacterium]|nr:AMP-binding protein [Saprospiraceae bacterium]
MPPFHTGGWNVLLTPFLHHGAYVCICKKFDPSVTLNLVGSEKATIFMGVPTMLLMMAEEVDFINTDFSDLLYMIVGGEAMPVPLIEKYHRKGVAIRQGYGMTEVGPNLTSLHQNDAIRKIGSIGRPNFYVNIKVVNEDGADALPNEPGELWLSGPMVTPGYWNNDAITASAFSEDGIWFKTGDIVVVTEDNYIYVVDRLKNMYISGGENVYPAEIEKVLNQIPEILECTVIGVKDEKWGEVGKAYIVWQNQKQAFDESFLKNYCQSKLAKFKVPKYFATLEALPKTDSGKTDKKKLKILHEQSANRD